MKLFIDFFVSPYWMHLLGLCFLTLSIFVAGQIIVDIGFSLLISGTIVNGLSHITQQFRDWRRDRLADQERG